MSTRYRAILSVFIICKPNAYQRKVICDSMYYIQPNDVLVFFQANFVVLQYVKLPFFYLLLSIIALFTNSMGFEPGLLPTDWYII